MIHDSFRSARQTNHLAGIHNGPPDTCNIECIGCGHPCRDHQMGTKCSVKGCFCEGFCRIADPEGYQDHLVSCLMVTRASRMHLARRAIECFVKQSYPQRELIIVSDDDLSALGVPYIRVPAGLSLGDLRNLAIGRASGAYVTQWDDDDWYHPERLTCQVKALREAPEADGCTLARWLIAWPKRNMYAVSGWRSTGWEGSILARRWRIPCYPGMARGEDVPVIENMRLKVLDDPHLYIYTVHGENTWDALHFELIFRHASRAVSPAERELMMQYLGDPQPAEPVSTLGPAPEVAT